MAASPWRPQRQRRTAKRAAILWREEGDESRRGKSLPRSVAAKSPGQRRTVARIHLKQGRSGRVLPEETLALTLRQHRRS